MTLKEQRWLRFYLLEQGDLRARLGVHPVGRLSGEGEARASASAALPSPVSRLRVAA